MKYTLVFLFLFFSIIVFCQGEPTVKFNKNSLGLEYDFNTSSPNIGITYRNFFENSKFNFRASIFAGGNNERTNLRDMVSLIYRTEDSVIPYIIVSNPKFTANSYQRVELGIERTFWLKKFDVILGAEMSFGHKYFSQLSTIDKAGEGYYPKNNIPYYRLIAVDSELYGGLNSHETTINYLTTGLGLQGGAKFDLFTNIYFTVLVNVRMEAQYKVSEVSEYRNELFKEHMPSFQEFSTINLYSRLRMGIHYSF